ncbi:polysaccharide deacetylase family protein [Blastopirellula marina]|uniref:NodB homology domain-containing protein n=1 Tax=Blastopirellula marina TaxID=124 RepID=A0A2S8F7L3_9BACT|nr:polysaccharide deacetylase family protein [Blastopirellula marina]PQO28152.1 hypothetical protein C5Y98_24930 [Blastopirellula marina]PTL41692.1 hypothetical protein C5Y97_24945 [Blastopirellula marina]
MKWPTYRTLAKRAESLGLNRLVRLVGSWRGLLVLTYHRIGDADQCEFDRGVYSTDEASFAEQMAFVRSHFEVVSIDDVVRRPAADWKKRQAVLITFDDGYIDNYEIAFPILKRLEIPALFFVTSGFIDQRSISWWDEIAWMVRKQYAGASDEEVDDAIVEIVENYYEIPEAECEAYLNRVGDDAQTGRYSDASPVWMTWEMLREMAASGMSFGGHTVSHPILTRTRSGNWEHELTEGRRRLEEELSVDVQVFSYPVGNPDCFSADLKQQTARHYRAAFSCYGGVNQGRGAGNWDRFDLRRWPVYGPMRQFHMTTTWPQLLN